MGCENRFNFPFLPRETQKPFSLPCLPPSSILLPNVVKTRDPYWFRRERLDWLQIIFHPERTEKRAREREREEKKLAKSKEIESNETCYFAPFPPAKCYYTCLFYSLAVVSIRLREGWKEGGKHFLRACNSIFLLAKNIQWNICQLRYISILIVVISFNIYVSIAHIGSLRSMNSEL